MPRPKRTFVGESDIVAVRGKPVATAERTRLFRYHKPEGLVTTHKDPAGRATVFQKLPSELPRLVSVGVSTSTARAYCF